MNLILASKSASRRAMLDAAGIAYRSVPADIDERAVEQELDNVAASVVAQSLAEAKALAVSRTDADALVIGSDSLVSVDDRRFDKPENREAAREHLRYFSGKSMELHSGVALARGGQIVWTHAEVARLQVRELTEDFIETYLAAEWPEVGQCVGVFRIEGRGVHLFKAIEGSQFTVLGMPLLPLLGALREHGVGL